jgi:PAS domain S-box-containing protein
LQFSFARDNVMHSMHRNDTQDLPHDADALCRRIIADADEGILVVDRECRYLLWNPKMELISGMREADVLGKTIWELFPFLRERGMEALIRQALAGETVNSPDFEYNVPATGKSGWSWQRMGPLRNARGEITGAIAFVSDITERKRLEVASEDQRLFAQALSGAAAGLCSTLNCSEVLDRILEYSSRVVTYDGIHIMLVESGVAKIVRGRGWNEQNPPPPDQEPFQFELAKFPNLSGMAESGKPDVIPDTRAHPNWVVVPGYEWIRSFAGAPMISKGQLFGFIGLISRTPVFFNAEHATRLKAFADQAAVALENCRLVKQRMQALQELRDKDERLQMAQRAESIGRLAGGVAHDVNNLLSAILGLSELARLSLASDSEAAHHLARIAEVARQGGDLTQQLLAFARKKIVKPEVVDLKSVILRMEPLLRRLIGENLDFELALGPDPSLVKVDVGSIEQVIMNLVLNARDAMPKGGRLTVEILNVVLSKDGMSGNGEVIPGPYVKFSVTDTGEGMPEDIRARIFEPFFTTKEVGRGTGLGLAMSQGVIKQAGGHIAVQSEVAKGSTFKIYLPLTQQPAERAELKPTNGHASAPKGGTETILLVEDEPLLRDVARRSLSALGYTVIDAPNGREALERDSSLKGPLHLLVTDVIMPIMGGAELAKTMSERRPGIRVLYSSGYFENAMVRHGIMHGGINFLQKPYTPSVLAERIRKILDQ